MENKGVEFSGIILRNFYNSIPEFKLSKIQKMLEKMNKFLKKIYKFKRIEVQKKFKKLKLQK